MRPRRIGNDFYHEPVLAAEVVRLLVTDIRGAYADLTAGGGGHLKALASVLEPQARLYGVDKDSEAVRKGTQTLSGLVQFREIRQASFGQVVRTAQHFDDRSFAGILCDLGVSSRQIDNPARGFSFMHDGPLDMRFDTTAGSTAADLVNTLNEKELARLIREYGEERHAVRIARAIVKERQVGPLTRTAQLADIIRAAVRPPHQTKSLARCFQALRIAVNREMDELVEVLPAAVSLLAPGGRLGVISYHSLEDRIVKRFFQQQSRPSTPTTPFEAAQPQAEPTLTLVTRKPVTPGAEEIKRNPRARSAKLRVAERI